MTSTPDNQIILQKLQELIRLMEKEQALPTDLRMTFSEIHDYILRNY